MKILVVDDEKSIRMSLGIRLSQLNVVIREASDGFQALEKFRAENFDIVILDIKMPGMSGIEVLKQIKQINKQCMVIMMTHLSEVKLAVEAMKLGASEYFTKPFSVEEITEVVEEVKNRQYINPAETNDVEIIGSSQSVRNIYKTIDKVCRIQAKTTILIHGESGTGKELVAKMISDKCAKDQPFVAINCAAIPTHLQESELFGHEKGAFSDAKDRRIGLFEHAQEGVLFLDEIGDMSLELQAKLLRVLQERNFRRIGGNKTIEFKAFVVAASNKKLSEEVEKGNFRQDLYYRLNIVPIQLPPLRSRKEDIVLLTEHFIEEYNKLFNKEVVGLSEDLMSYFMAYDWPGNIRELKNIIERLMIFSESSLLSSSELPYELICSQQKDIELTNLESAERETVLRALSDNSWNITRAAGVLNISRLTLRRKIDKYGLKK